MNPIHYRNHEIHVSNTYTTTIVRDAGDNVVRTFPSIADAIQWIDGWVSSGEGKQNEPDNPACTPQIQESNK